LTAEKVGRATLVCRWHGVKLERDTPVATMLRSPIVSLNKNPFLRRAVERAGAAPPDGNGEGDTFTDR
jgi:hypothetical protein